MRFIFLESLTNPYYISEVIKVNEILRNNREFPHRPDIVQLDKKDLELLILHPNPKLLINQIITQLKR